MPGPTHGYGLGISPASTHLVGGHGVYHATVSVSNPGASPIAITMSVAGLTPSGPKCTVPTAAPSWLHFTGARTFVLAGHQSHPVSITVDATSQTIGSAAVVASATPAKNTPGAARIGASVGSRVTVGTTASCHAKPVTLPAPQAPGGGFDLRFLLILVVIAAGVAIAIRRHHNN